MVFVVQKLRLFILRFNVKHIYGPEKIILGTNELVIFCLVKNGEPWMRSFLKHYFSLGAKHIVFLDNGSTDMTISIAQEYENVTVVQTRLSYKNYKIAMKQYLIKRFGYARWSLSVDIDEFFDYPYSNDISLEIFLNYLNNRSYTAVVAHLLDMFSDNILSSQGSEDIVFQRGLHIYYDITDITKMKYYFPRNRVSNPEIRVYFGGIRRILFGATDGLGDLLTKHPLIFFDGKIKSMFLDDHDIRQGQVADLTCVLLHYKFLADFHKRAIQIAREEHYSRKSIHYKRYAKVLKERPVLQIKQESSQQLNNINELIENKFLVVSQDYIDWVKAHKYPENA